MAVAVITFLWLLFAAGKVQLFQNTHEVGILFDYISGLEKNAPVQFAGHKVGKVEKIDFVNTGGARVRVTISLSDKVVLKKDSEAYIDIMGFMGEKFVEVTPGSSGSEPLPAHEPLRGVDPVPMMKIVKDGTELLSEFEKTQGSLQRLVTELEGIVGDNRGNVDQTFGNLNQASQNLKEMTHDLKLHPWKLLKKSGEKRKRFFVF